MPSASIFTTSAFDITYAPAVTAFFCRAVAPTCSRRHRRGQSRFRFCVTAMDTCAAIISNVTTAAVCVSRVSWHTVKSPVRFSCFVCCCVGCVTEPSLQLLRQWDSVTQGRGREKLHESIFISTRHHHCGIKQKNPSREGEHQTVHVSLRDETGFRRICAEYAQQGE